MANRAITITTVVTASTTRADPAPFPLTVHALVKRHLPFALMALAAVAVVLMAWPRLQASYRYLPVDIALDRYFRERAIPSDRLTVLIGFAREAIARHDHPRFQEGLSLLHQLRALDPNTPALERRGAYQAAEAAAQESLARAPAQPGTWLRLAQIRWVLREEPERVVEPWRMSVFTGRTAAPLLAARVEIGLVFEEYLDTEASAMLRDQLLLAWRMQPGTLMAVLARRDRTLERTRRFVESADPAALAEMEVWLARLR